MKVLLTRPEGRNHAMEQALAERGIPFMVTPLLAVEAMEDKSISPTEVQDADIIVFVSTNAVHFGTQALNASWPSHIQYFAVGEATFEAFAHYGIQGHKAPDDNQQTEGLLTLPGLQPEVVTQESGHNSGQRWPGSTGKNTSAIWRCSQVLGGLSPHLPFL